MEKNSKQNETEFNKNTDKRRARMMRELQSDLCDLVESGDITESEANEWASEKADQWA